MIAAIDIKEGMKICPLECDAVSLIDNFTLETVEYVRLAGVSASIHRSGG
ncbi:hypothetical protein F7734_57185 [Scytonema sp. UIC 10036]|nr:hypothetical protein [Scytonema sp. UIC 10036]